MLFVINFRLEPTHSNTNGPQKKKTATASSTGGIESIVRRLHQVRTETPPPRSPLTDCESADNFSGPGDDDDDDFVTVSFGPKETACNSESSSAPSIPNRAATSIYSSGRTGRKRVFVKREPGTEGSDHQDQSSRFGLEQQSDSSGNEQTWPVRIKQEPMDDDAEEATTGTDDDKQDSLLSSTPGSLGQFVRNAASWVSNLVASELEKPSKKVAAAAARKQPPRQTRQSTAAEADAMENLFSETRLHKIIEQQLIKTPEPMGPDNDRLLHSMIAEQLSKPVSIPMIKVEPGEEDHHEKQIVADAKAARKEQKRARKEAKTAKKMKKALKRERLAAATRPQSHSPFGNSSSERSSPYEKSASPLVDKTSSPASHCLESFARMIQMRDFQSGGASQGPATMVRQLPIPTSQGLVASRQNVSPAPTTDNQVPQVTHDEHPASLFLRSFAQRTSTPPEGNSMYGDQGKGNPLEQLLKAQANPEQPNSAKSQLEHLLKSKNIKSQWATPSPSHSPHHQTVPYDMTQANMEATNKYSSSSTHILKVPKVMISGRKSYSADQDPFQKMPIFDRMLEATGLSSDSEDGEYRERKTEGRDPDWVPGMKAPTPSKRPRKRSLPRSPYAKSGGQGQGMTRIPAGYDVYPVGDIVFADKENGEPSGAKHPRLGQDLPAAAPADFTATNTLARLLKMTKPSLASNSDNNSVRGSDGSEQMYESPKRDFTAKQSAVGVMQAFAQLVEIQGISPPMGMDNIAVKTEPDLLLSESLPYQTPEKSKSLLSDSLPLLTPDVGKKHQQNSGKKAAGKDKDQNGNGDAHKETLSNGDEPEDLTMYSKIKIKLEPRDDSEQSPPNHRTNGKSSPVEYTCSLCAKVFHSKMEVTEHKMIVHYSSGCEMVS